MIIDCISDLHGHYPELEGGDLLIVAGDLTARDTEEEHGKFFDWLYQQNYTGMVFIAGNHDGVIEKDQYFFNRSNPNRVTEITRNAHAKVQYLCDSGTEFAYREEFEPEPTGACRPDCKFFRTRKLKIWGSPWTKRFKGMNPKCMAFTVDTEEELATKWTLIPDDTDILVTHCPPYGYMDCIEETNTGSYSLLKRSYGSNGVFPMIHIFGHIHEQGGKIVEIGGTLWPSQSKTIFINASHVNERYEPVNKPIRVIL